MVHTKEKNLTVFPGGPVVKNSPCTSEDSGSISRQGTKVHMLPSN